MFLVAEMTTTSYDENHAFFVAAPNTSIGAVTSLVKKPSKTKIPIFDDAALAELTMRNAKPKTASIADRFTLLILISPFLFEAITPASGAPTRSH